MSYWNPSERQLAARKEAEQLSEKLSAELPGPVLLDDLTRLNARARVGGARHLMLLPPDGAPVAIPCSCVSQLRKARSALKRKGSTLIIDSDGLHVRWASGALLIREQPLYAEPRLEWRNVDQDRTITISFGRKARKEAA